jgi:dipeptidase
MTRGVDAGPFGTPNRWRPITWKVGEEEYTWERPISTQQTGFSQVTQSRAHLPDPVGGVYWYGMDDTYTTCYVPLYCGMDRLPESFTRGRLDRFSWDFAPWSDGRSARRQRRNRRSSRPANDFLRVGMPPRQRI